MSGCADFLRAIPDRCPENAAQWQWRCFRQNRFRRNRTSPVSPILDVADGLGGGNNLAALVTLTFSCISAERVILLVAANVLVSAPDACLMSPARWPTRLLLSEDYWVSVPGRKTLFLCRLRKVKSGINNNSQNRDDVFFTQQPIINNIYFLKNDTVALLRIHTKTMHLSVHRRPP